MNSGQITAQSVQQAVEVLRERMGEQIAGGMESGMARMREALQAGMGVDESQADVLVKHLAQTRQIIYRGSADVNDDDVTPVVPLPRDNPGIGGLFHNTGHGLTTPIAGVVLDEDRPSDSSSLLEVNEAGYWTLSGAEAADNFDFRPAPGPTGDTYNQPGDTNSYAADLSAAGQEQDASARERQ